MAQRGVTHTRLGARGAGVLTPSLSSKRAGGDPAPRARGGQAAPRGAITITATEGNQSKVKGHKRVRSLAHFSSDSGDVAIGKEDEKDCVVVLAERLCSLRSVVSITKQGAASCAPA
jgi:hypothetical protein